MLQSAQKIKISKDFTFRSFYQNHEKDFGKKEDEKWIDNWLLDLEFTTSRVLDHSELWVILCSGAKFKTIDLIDSFIESVGGVRPGLEGAALAYLQARDLFEESGERTILSLVDSPYPIRLNVQIMPTISIFKYGFWKLRWSPQLSVFSKRCPDFFFFSLKEPL